MADTTKMVCDYYDGLEELRAVAVVACLEMQAATMKLAAINSKLEMLQNRLETAEKEETPNG